VLGNGHKGGVVVAHVMAPHRIRAVRKPVGVLVVSGAKQKSGRVDRPARYHHDVGRIFLQVTIALDQNLVTTRPEASVSRLLT